jgi:hypothetical protein
MTVDPGAACLYVGHVMHCRLRPFRHRFRYGVFSMLLDLDRIDAVAAELLGFAHNRFAPLAFHDRDHGPRDGTALRPWIEEMQVAHGLAPGGRIRIHCFPRVLGYAFNPLAVYFLDHPGGGLQAVVYEVRNTFGDKHCYLAPVADDAPVGAPLAQSARKTFHVSPFFDIAGGYRFRVIEPDERLSILIRLTGPDGERLVATQTGQRRALSDRAILGALARFPLMTFKVITAIHWQALKLWLRGAAFHRRPEPPALPVTLADADGSVRPLNRVRP